MIPSANGLTLKSSYIDKDGRQKRSYLAVIFQKLCTTLNSFFHERKEWAYDYLLIRILLANNIVFICNIFLSPWKKNGKMILCH